jgi:hypothetical protein
MKMIHLYIVVEDDAAVEAVEHKLADTLSTYHWDITDVEDSEEAAE